MGSSRTCPRNNGGEGLGKVRKHDPLLHLPAVLRQKASVHVRHCVKRLTAFTAGHLATAAAAAIMPGMINLKMDKVVVLARGLGKRMRRNDGTAQVDGQAAVAEAGIKALIPIDRPFLD